MSSSSTYAASSANAHHYAATSQGYLQNDQLQELLSAVVLSLSSFPGNKRLMLRCARKQEWQNLEALEDMREKGTRKMP